MPKGEIKILRELEKKSITEKGLKKGMDLIRK
jgi:hypothetical protein